MISTLHLKNVNKFAYYTFKKKSLFFVYKLGMSTLNYNYYSNK